MSINVSAISEYLFCPLKLYLKHHLTEDNEPKLFKAIFIQQINQDFQDIIRKNVWSVEKGMNLSEIETILSSDLDLIIDRSIERFEDESQITEDVINIKNSIKKNLLLESQLMAVKVKIILNNLQKDGPQISEILFPPTLQSYLIHDKSLKITGSADKIEIVDGKYYPIEIKQGNPPIRGVWDSDALKIAAYGLLIEQEFDTEVLVGFIDYKAINERRPVVIDSDLREGLFSVLDDIRDIVYHQSVPEVEINPNKCSSCHYMPLCQNPESY